MVIWGAVWGAMLGLLWQGRDWEFHAIAGATLGAAAGWSLRRVVRTEIAKAMARLAATAQSAAGPAAAPVAAVPATASAPAAVGAAAAAAPGTAGPATAQPPSTPLRPAPSPAPAAPPRPSLLETLARRARDWLLGGNTVVRMGVLVLFVGLAFLAKYAVDHSLLPPELRLAGIGAAGIALFVFGVRLRRAGEAKRGYALTLQGAGIAVLYLAVFAAFRLYHFLPAPAAFVALGLICAFSAAIALAQNALVLAFIGFAGGYAAPLLVSTGQGNHVGLFSYYLLLGVAIASIAWLRAWRPLNLLGFFATFGVATAWGVLRYSPEQLPTTQAFLAAFFLVFLLATLFYALRHGTAARKAVDATLVFGLPIVAFGLQAGLVHDIPYASAFSALALGALYLALGWWLLRRRRGDAQVHRWLAECFVALALGFLTLAVPLALDGRWTSAAWAVEGAAVYWMGRRQCRWLPRAAGLALQAMGAVLFLESTSRAPLAEWPLANPAFLGAAMLAGSALAIAWWSRESMPPAEGSRMEPHFAPLEHALSPLLFWVGFLWLQAAFHHEIGRMTLPAAGGIAYVFDGPQRVLLQMLGWVLAAFALHRLATPQRERPWAIAATPAWLSILVLLLTALWGMASQDHVFQSGGWIAWPLALALHLRMLRALDGGRPAAWWPWVHAGGVWLLVLLAGNLLVFAIGRAQLWQTAWATVMLLVAGSAVLLLFTQRSLFEGAPSLRWPLDRFAHAYAVRAAQPLAAALVAGALLVAVHSSGNARPLPYVPLLNPTDLSVALALAVSALWLLRVRSSALPAAAMVRGIVAPAALAIVAFVAINTVWLRVAHHYAGVPWEAGRLSDSFLVQAGYSILWTLIAVALMVGAHRRAVRVPWMVGAALLGLTVLKLFVIDLSNRGGSERIVVFIAVGVLMLVVGWFAPLPPARRGETAAGAGEAQGATP